MKKILTSENIFFCLVLVIGIFLSLFPMFYELFRRNDIFSDRYFVLVYNFAPDYNAYLSKIIQGIQGRWSVVEYFTSEPHQGSLLQIFYLSLGKIGALFSSSPEFSYHLGRIALGIGWVFVGWQFIKFSFTDKFYRKITLLLFVFAGNFPKLVPDQGGYGFEFLGLKWEQTLVGWSNLDPVRRLTFIPHWNAGHVFGTLALLFFIKHLSQDTKYTLLNTKLKVSSIKYLVLSIIFALITGFTLPSMLVGMYALLGLWFIYKLITERKILANTSSYIKHHSFWLISLIIFVGLTFTSLIYNLWITSFYPWKALVETDLYVNRTSFEYIRYLTALGPTGFLGLAGAFLVLFFKKEKLFWSSFWVMGMFILIIVFDHIQWHNQTRFLEVGPELPLSVLSVFSLSVVGSFLGKFKKLFVLICTVLLMFLAVFVFAISIKAQMDFIDHKILGSYPRLSLGNYVVYPVKPLMEGVLFLKNTAMGDEVILSGYITGNHIGAYAGKFVYIGHGSQTVRFYQEKQPRTIEFYQGRMNEEAAKNFLRENRIEYVFFGPEEKTYGEYPSQANFLKPIFRNEEVTVYQVDI